MPTAHKKNKLGQRIQQRGADTRRKLLDAALRLLKKRSPIEISVHDIARAAGTSPATYYVYFSDVKDILFELCEAIHDGIREVLPTLNGPWPAKSRTRHIRAFVNAYCDFWHKHRLLCNVRNLEADLGDARFFDARFRASRPIQDALADRIMEARPRGSRLTYAEAWSQTVVVLSALELIYVYNPRTYVPDRPVSIQSVLDAQVHIFSMLMRGK